MIVSPGQDLEDISKERVERNVQRAKTKRDFSRFIQPQENRVLRETWIIGSLLLVVVGVASDEIVLSLVGAAVFVAGWLARGWGRVSLRNVELTQELSQTHAFVGEQLDYQVRVENKKLLPLPWLHARLVLPPALEPSNRRLQVTDGENEAFLERRTSMRWYERITWTYHIPLQARGFYKFGATRLRSGDLFGFFTRQRDEPECLRLWVYPETVPLPELGLPLYRPYGESSGGQPLFEDPSRLKGLRDYRAGDSLKRVDWKATARHQKLRSRIYDPSSNPQVVIALNVTTVPPPYRGTVAEIFEQAISVAVTLATAYADERLPFGLISNCSYPEEDSTIRVPAGRSDRQLLMVLEALAMAGSFTLVDMERLLEEETRRLPLGSTIVLVTGLATPRLDGALNRVRQRGHRVAVVYLGIEDPPPLLGGVPVADIREALDGISFTRVGGRSMKRADIDYRDLEGGEPLEADEDGSPDPEGDQNREAAPVMTGARAGVPAAVADSSPWSRPGDGGADPS